MEDLLKRYTEKLEYFESEHAKALKNEREARRANDSRNKVFWSDAKMILVSKMELCSEFVRELQYVAAE